MSEKIGFVGTCVANLNKSPSYIDGEKHCYYDCKLKFGKESDIKQWNSEDRKAILLKDFFDIGTKSTSMPDFGQPACLGQVTELNSSFSPALPESRATAFAVDSRDLQGNAEKPVTRMINKLLNGIN